MEKDYGLFTWGDNWQIEGDKTWFVSGMYNILFRMDLRTKECELAVCIPEEAPSKFRLTPYCLKCENSIFCMPDNGAAIWIYDIKKNNFSKITLNNPNKVRLKVYDFWKYENKLFAVSNGLGQIIEIDIIKKKIEKYHILCDEGKIEKSIKAGTKIYSLSSVSNEVYQFDLNTKKIMTYKIPNIERKFSTFCFDGEKFWLSGYRKEIYVWDMEKNTVKTIGGFPGEFGIYNFAKDTEGEVDCIAEEYEQPVFLNVVAVDRNIWFLPYQANKIIYMDKENNKLHVFEVDDENETKQSLLERTSLWSKYILEYIREDRYIGLFSVKNNCILEIDALQKKSESKKYVLGNQCMQQITQMYAGSILYEDRFSKEVFKTALLNRSGEEKNKISMNTNTGLRIYEEMLKL